MVLKLNYKIQNLKFNQKRKIHYKFCDNYAKYQQQKIIKIFITATNKKFLIQFNDHKSNYRSINQYTKEYISKSQITQYTNQSIIYKFPKIVSQNFKLITTELDQHKTNNRSSQSIKFINKDINRVEVMQSTSSFAKESHGDEQKAYKLQRKPSCSKHPSKSIQYFCKHPQCTQRLSCSSCLLKKQFCRHDINTYVVDIAEFVYEQKMAFEMRGLSKQEDIHEYLVNKQSRRQMYYQVVNGEIEKFDNQLDNLLQSITTTITQLKQNIKSQLEQFKTSYEKTEQMMFKKVEQGFKQSYLAKFQTFQQCLASKDISNSIGLKELLEKFTFEIGDEGKNKDIRKYYDNLISMHDETPEIDYSRFESIRSYFTVFETKLNQAGPLLITLHKSTTSNLALQKDTNPNAMLQTLINLPMTSVKKIAKSTSFPSNHARTIYVICKLPDRKLITGSDDGAINLFDMTTFQNIGSYQCHISGIRSMILLPNGKLVTGSYDKTIKIWPDPTKIGDLSESKLILSQVSTLSNKKNTPLIPLKMLTGHTSVIISLKYLNDGSTFASGSADYTIKVWDYERGQNIKNFSGHMSDVLCLQCTSTGYTLISGSSDRTIKVWSLTKKYSSACLKTLTGHTDYIWTICLLQDNVTLFSAGLDKMIKMWDITTGNLIRNLPNQHVAHITKILQYTKEVIVSCANDGTIKFWDWKGNCSIHSLQMEAGISTMMIMAEQGIVAAGQDKNLYLCD